MENKRVIIEASTSVVYESKVQDAINECYEAGGGIIQLNPGRHYSLPIVLKNNTHLLLDRDAEIIFSSDFSDYSPVFTRWEGTECHALQAMIYAENSNNIKISGGGTINGAGEKWWSAYRSMRAGEISAEVQDVMDKIRPLNKDIKAGSGGGGIETNFLRPSLFQCKNCSEVELSDVKFENPAFWNTHILYSEHVTIKNVEFKSPEDAPNTDGLDIDSSSYVTVEDCLFNVGDDCLCLKSGMDEDGYRVGKSTHHITVKGCMMNKGHGGIVLGSETSGGIHDIDISHCTMNETDRGIRLKTRRKRCGALENIKITNMIMDGVICPIVMNMYYRCGSKPEDVPFLASLEKQEFRVDMTPSLKNITIHGVKASNVKSAALFFMGLPESPVDGLDISNINILTNSKTYIDQPAMDLFDTKCKKGEVYLLNVINGKFHDIKIDGKEVEITND